MVFGSNKNKKICFWNLLTINMKSERRIFRSYLTFLTDFLHIKNQIIINGSIPTDFCKKNTDKTMIITNGCDLKMVEKSVCFGAWPFLFSLGHVGFSKSTNFTMEPNLLWRIGFSCLYDFIRNTHNLEAQLGFMQVNRFSPVYKRNEHKKQVSSFCK